MQIDPADGGAQPGNAVSNQIRKWICDRVGLPDPLTPCS